MHPFLAEVRIEDVWRPAQIEEFQSIGGFISFFLPKALIVAGIIVFAIIVVSGLGVVMSAGNLDSHGMEGRKMILTYAVVGLALIFFSLGILQIINFLTDGTFSSIL